MGPLDGLSDVRGVQLASSSSGRLRTSGLSLPRPVPPPEGPSFRYETAPSLFLGRRGLGPLRVAWDTNLLIDYFELGRHLWEGWSLPETVPGEHGEELEGLQMVLSLWVLRDIRFHIPPGVLDDSKRKTLSPARRESRSRAWREFSSALTSVGEDEEMAMLPRGDLPADSVDAALRKVPAGNDRALVEFALLSGMHVFLTCDKGVLGARSAFEQLGLLLASPLDLLEELSGAGALHCLFAPEYLYWPLPDQTRVRHLIRAMS